MDLHELVGRGIFPVDRRHVRVAGSGQAPVRRLDFLVGGGGGDAEDVVERGTRGVEIRRPRLVRPGRASIGGGGGGGEGDYWAGSDATGRRNDGVGGERRWKGEGGDHVGRL